MPPWVSILEAANFDPLRAQQIETDLTQYWWDRWLLYTKENRAAQVASDKKAARKAKRTKKHGK